MYITTDMFEISNRPRQESLVTENRAASISNCIKSTPPGSLQSKTYKCLFKSVMFDMHYEL